jgi:hypothetical protein
MEIKSDLFGVMETLAPESQMMGRLLTWGGRGWQWWCEGGLALEVPFEESVSGEELSGVW